MKLIEYLKNNHLIGKGTGKHNRAMISGSVRWKKQQERERTKGLTANLHGSSFRERFDAIFYLKPISTHSILEHEGNKENDTK